MQVFYLDHIDLGVYNKPRNLSPRICLFDYETIKKMVDHLSSVNGGDGSFFPPGPSAQVTTLLLHIQYQIVFFIVPHYS